MPSSSLICPASFPSYSAPILSLIKRYVVNNSLRRMTKCNTIPMSSSSGSTSIEFISRAKHQLKSGLTTRWPWKEMLQIHLINLSSGFRDIIRRIKMNIGYFRMNYVIIVLLILFLSLLWHPISLIVFVALMAVWLFLYFLRDEPLVIFHRLIDDRTVVIVLSVVTVVLLLLTGATLNILLSVLVGLVVVVIHVALRKKDNLFLDEEAAETGGLLTSSS